MLRADPGARPRARRALLWAQTLLLLVALAALLSGFHLVIEGWEWWWTSVGVVGAVLLGAAVARQLRLPPALVALAVWLVVLTVTFAPSSTVLGVVPTPSSVPALLDVGRQAGRVIVEEVAPVDPDGSISFVLAAAFGLLAIVMDTLLVSLASATGVGVVMVGMYVCPPLIVGDEPDLAVFVLVAAVWLVLLRLEDGGGPRSAPLGVHRVPALVIGTGALVLSVAVPTVLPRVVTLASDWGADAPEVFSRGVNPMLELGSNLRRGATVESLEYSTTADSAQYLRVATLRDFDGETWEPSGPTRFGIDETPPEPSRGTQVERTVVRIRDLDSPRLPLPYRLADVEGLEGSWRVNDQGLTMSSQSASTEGQTYAVEALPVDPTEDEIRDAGRSTGLGVRPYLGLPEAMPDVIERTARQVTAGMTNDYDRATALQSYFRDGSFEYSETAPVEEGYDGNGVDVIATFLDVRAGYCVHFSSSMAVMARTLGIPSRVVVGFAPGERTGTEDDGRAIYTNTSETLHAWPELYFDGVGWVRFEPTPGIGSATDFSAPDETEIDPEDSATPTPSAPTPTPSQRPDESPQAQAQQEQQDAGRDLAPLLGGAAVVVLLLGVPAAVRTARRRLRWRAAATAVAPAWDEVLDTAYDLGLPARPRGTPREEAAALAEAPGADVDALDRVLGAYERERFGRPQDAAAPDVRTDAGRVVAGLRAAASRPVRWRAALAPRSLLGRRDTAVRASDDDRRGATLGS